MQIEVQGSAAHQLRYSEIQAIKQLEKQEMNDRRSTMNANCNAAQVTALNNWQSDAIQKINAAIACTESSCSTLVRFAVVRTVQSLLFCCYNPC